MKITILLAICVCLLLFPASAYAKIIADQEFNDSLVFYFWDGWINPVGIGSGGYWLTFIKHIDKTNQEFYWIRLDSTRRDSISQYGKIFTTKAEYKIEALDNPLGIHQRAGIGGRINPPLCPIHAYYIVSPEMINNLASSGDAAKITLDFQNRKDIPFPISEGLQNDLKKLLTLKRSDYQAYARKP